MLIADSLLSSWEIWLLLIILGVGWTVEKAVKNPGVQRGAANWFFGRLFK